MPALIFVGVHTVLIKGQQAVVEADHIVHHNRCGPLAVGDIVLPSHLAPGHWFRAADFAAAHSHPPGQS